MVTIARRDMYVDGQWTAAHAGEAMEVMNPATEEVVGTVPVARSADLDAALEAAERGWHAWREVDAWTRSAHLRHAAAILRERAGAIATVLTEEQGKPLSEARAELDATADQFDWYADEARRIYGRVIDGHLRTQRLLVIRQSVGPVAAFTPSNFPALLPARKVAPALAAGCSVILKPSEEAPFTALALAGALHDTGLPSGALNVVTGDAEAITTHLLASDVIRKVSLTGPVPVGRALLRLAADRILPSSMELGGHAPVLVFADVDVEHVAQQCARGKFRNCGQVCISASRFYVHASIVDRFTEAMAQTARRLRVGDGRDPSTDVGPVTSRRRRDAVEALVLDAVERGATVVCGGRCPPDRATGWFFEPTVLGGVPPEAEVMRAEPFGPVAPIAAFETLDEAVDLANSTPYGLASFVFTRDLPTAFNAAEGIEAGMVGVNQLFLAAAEIPFGGVKHSGFGREGGAEGIDAYVVTKHINMNLAT